RVLLPEMGLTAADAVGQAFERGRPVTQVRQEAAGNLLVELEDIGLGDAVVRVHQLVGMSEANRTGGRAGCLRAACRGAGSVALRGLRRARFLVLAIALSASKLVLHLDEEPVVFFFIISALHANECETAFELVAMQRSLYMPGAYLFGYVLCHLLLRRPIVV